MSEIFDPVLASRIEKSGIVAVLIVDDEEDAVPLAEALLAGGVNVMELTLRTPAALPALKKIKAEVPNMIAGVGTILMPDQVREVADLGAAFGVSPGVSRRVMDAALGAGLPFAPGVVTPSDIEAALEYECKLLKFFPCEPSGGLPFLKAMAAPYAHLGVKFIPLGGVNVKNMATYLTDPLISALGGSWLAPRESIKARDWTTVTRLASEATQTIQSIRKS